MQNGFGGVFKWLQIKSSRGLLRPKSLRIAALRIAALAAL